MATNNIAEIRRSQKMEQTELAKKLNVTMNYISTLENKKEINGITLHRISEAINTTECRIFDFSDRKRTKPDFNPHLEAFWVQGCQAHDYLDEPNRIMLVDRLLCGLDKELSESIAPIREIMYLHLFDVYCLMDYADDTKTTESITDMELMFACGVLGADFFLCAAILDKRVDIIQSFINGLVNTKEFRGGKEGYNNIPKIREQNGLTQTALAEMSKITLSILRLIESKNHCSDVHLKSAKKIARALDCEITDLFSNTPKDIYNIQAKSAGIKLRKAYDTFELQKSLDRDKDSIAFCVRDIIGFLNGIKAKDTEQFTMIQYDLI